MTDIEASRYSDTGEGTRINMCQVHRTPRAGAKEGAVHFCADCGHRERVRAGA